MLEIAVIGFHYHHPDARRSIAVLSALAKNFNIRLHVITVTHWLGFKDPYIEKCRNERLSIHFLEPVFLSKESHQFRYFMRRLFRTLRQIDPDFIYMVNEPIAINAFLATLCAKILRKRIICFTWENLDIDRPKLVKMYERAMLRMIDFLIAGNYDAKLLLRKKGVPERKIIGHFPHCGIDTRQFSGTQGMGGKYNLPKGKTCLFAGRLEDFKGISTILKAKDILEREGKRYHYLFVGKGAWLDVLRKRARQDPYLTVIPWIPREEMPKVYHSAALFLYPQVPTPVWEEQFGFAMVEAMAAGLPVIASSVSGSREIVEHGKSGFLIPPNDAVQLASSISLLLDDHKKLKLFQKGARARAQNFDNAKIARKLFETFSRIPI